MNHRKTIGFESDVAESAALTIVDERATERIYEACDWEHDRKKKRTESTTSCACSTNRTGRSQEPFCAANLGRI